jgi:hypothetical protein
VLGEKRVAFLIAFGVVAEAVALAINLDAKLGGVAVKIEDVTPEWVLPANVAAIKNVRPNLPPKQNFREAHPPA